jgi:hypothetical protein
MAQNLKLPIDVMIEFVLLPTLLERIYLSPFWSKVYKLTKWIYGHILHPLLFNKNWSKTTELWRVCTLGLDLSFAMVQASVDMESDTQPLLQDGLQKRKASQLPPATSQSSQSVDWVEKAASIPVVVLRLDQTFLHSSFKYERRQIETFTNSIAHLQTVCDTLVQKKFPPGTNQSSQARLLFAIICYISQTYNCVLYLNNRSSTKFDSTNPGHENLLKTLWESLMDKPLEKRISEEWKLLGFQGKDPSTDFRAMGMLGLENLVYFAEVHPRQAKQQLIQSWGGAFINQIEMSVPVTQPGPENAGWYPYAITSINISQFALELARTRQLQRLFYEAAGKCAHLNVPFATGTVLAASLLDEQDWQKEQMRAVKTVYQEFYCYLMVSFHKQWTLHQPLPNVMDFNRIFAEFKQKMQVQLQTDSGMCVLDASSLR